MHQSFVAPGRLPGHLVGSVYDPLRGHVDGHMRGRDGFTPYQRRHGEDAPYRMYSWGSLVFAHLHKPVVEDEDESDRALEADSLHFGVK